MDLQRRPFAMKPEYVLVEQLAEHGALLLQAALDGVELVAELGGTLVLELAGSILHPCLQLAGQLVGLALQEEGHLLHGPPVLLLRNVVHARRRAALDLVLQAGPAPIRHHRVGAGAELEVAVHDAQRLPDGGRARERPEVPRSVLAHPPHHFQPGVGVRVREPQRDEVLVVAQLDVEAGPVLLDQLVLEQDRVLLGRSDHHLHVGKEILEEGDESAGIAAALLEVLADAGAQVDGLADVHDVAGLVLHHVAAGLRRQRLELLLQLSGEHRFSVAAIRAVRSAGRGGSARRGGSASPRRRAPPASALRAAWA